jgi:SNF2 family DNA or RNA helicase
MVFNDLPWVPADLQQAEKRIHRIGQQERCFYYYVIDPGMGELIYKTLEAKIKDLEGIK